MTDREWAAWCKSLIVAGEQAFTPDEWEARCIDLAQKREGQARYYRGWVARNREHVRAYKREWNRRRRMDPEYRARERRRDHERHAA